MMLAVRRLIPLLLLLGLSWPARARAQETTQNPHGTLAAPCSDCHTADGWSVTRVPKGFRHAPATFPLGGAHASTSCRSCHRALDFAGAPLACASCHRDVHQGELGADCNRCHSDRAFVDRASMLRQHQSTRFVLNGSHVAVDCEQCHQSKPQGAMQFVNTPTQCGDCHGTQFLAAREPDHEAGGFSRDCTQCHATSLWTPARFNHAASRFPLTGAHRSVACTQCHAGNRFAGTPSECVGCHAANWQGTTDPSHQALNFPQECTQCHSTVSWSGAAFDHAATGFALTGAHRATACDQCHAAARFGGTPTDCFSCHQADYQRPTDPSHVAAGFPQACAQCHTTTTWTGARFDHASTRFPLTGLHTTVACANCHVNNVFAGAPTTCFGCHAGTFTATRDPAHQAAGLSTDCLQCHATTGWANARYTAHDALYFPIYSGAHNGKWSASCATCHTNPASYATFTCLTCHLKPQMDSKHAGRSGYSYDSNSCYRCHPSGKGD
jgi:nitrate/TMAO reductase-like tetraheme cytochrome c subunit